MQVYRFLFFAFLILALVACQPPYEQGKTLYIQNCANCHMKDGSGLGEEIPDLRNSTASDQQLVCIIRNGIQKEKKVGRFVYESNMPAFPELSNAQLSNLVNYIKSRWSDQQTFTSPKSVEGFDKNCNQ